MLGNIFQKNMLSGNFSIIKIPLKNMRGERICEKKYAGDSVTLPPEQLSTIKHKAEKVKPRMQFILIKLSNTY